MADGWLHIARTPPSHEVRRLRRQNNAAVSCWQSIWPVWHAGWKSRSRSCFNFERWRASLSFTFQVTSWSLCVSWWCSRAWTSLIESWIKGQKWRACRRCDFFSMLGSYAIKSDSSQPTSWRQFRGQFDTDWRRWGRRGETCCRG